MSILDVSVMEDKIKNGKHLRDAIGFMYPEFKYHTIFHDFAIFENDRFYFKVFLDETSKYLFNNGMDFFFFKNLFLPNEAANAYSELLEDTIESTINKLKELLKANNCSFSNFGFISKPKYNLRCESFLKEGSFHVDAKVEDLQVYHFKLSYEVLNVPKTISKALQEQILSELEELGNLDIPLTRKVNCSRKRMNPKDGNSDFVLKGQIYFYTFFGLPLSLFKERFLLIGGLD